MPWVNPQLIPERVTKFKPLLEFEPGQGLDVVVLLEKRSNWNKGGNCRIVLQTPAKKGVKEKDKLKSLLAVSGEDGDLLENEWTFILKELPGILPKVPMETQDLFNWLVAHFSMMYTKERIEDIERNGALLMQTQSSKQLLHSVSSNNGLGGGATAPSTPATSPSRTRLSFSSDGTTAPVKEDKSEEEKISKPTELPSPRRAFLQAPEPAETPKAKPAVKEVVENVREAKETGQPSPSSSNVPQNVTPPHIFIMNSLEYLPPHFLVIGVVVNVVLFVIHELFPRALFGALLVALNAILMHYWIWYNASFPKQKTTSDKGKRKLSFRVDSESCKKIEEKQVTAEKKDTGVGEKEPPVKAAKKALLSHATEDISSKVIQEVERQSKIVSPPPEALLEDEIKIEHKLVPGTTCFKIGTDPADRKYFGEWTWAPADTFIVRQGPNYAMNKKKAPSEDALYEVLAVDNYGLERKIWHVAKFFDLAQLESSTLGTPAVDPEREGSSGNNSESDKSGKEQFQLPEFLILNVLCPLYAPGIFAPTIDGEGFMTIVFCRLTSKTKALISEGNISPGMRLFRRFIDEAHIDGSLRGRLKGIARCNNGEELNFGGVVGGLINRYNSTPFLIQDGQAEFYSGSNYFEIDADVHKFSTLARNGFYHVKHVMQQMRTEYGFLIEGRSDEEMPEQILLALQTYDMQTTAAPPFPVSME